MDLCIVICVIDAYKPSGKDQHMCVLQPAHALEMIDTRTVANAVLCREGQRILTYHLPWAGDSGESACGDVRSIQASDRTGTMNTPLRKPANHDGFVVDYHDDVTEEQVRKIDDLLKDEFRDGEWVTVEKESW